MKSVVCAILICVVIACVYGADPCDNVSCHFGLGFVTQRQNLNFHVCGSDGVTYTFCDFKKAICRDNTLTFAKVGTC